MSNDVVRYWAVVPAAGAGRRMGGPLPKQYLPLNGIPILYRTLQRLASAPFVEGIVVALNAEDEYWEAPALRCPTYTVTGGAERCHSVLSGLDFLADKACDDDWVLVHDAARPCLRVADIEHLRETLTDETVGGLLGLPISDTVKRTDSLGRVEETIPRDGLWRAMTPQMFRYGVLRKALREAIEQDILVTDEATAIEEAGLAPLMVEGQADNIKVTRPTDMALAEIYLMQQES